MLRTRAKTSVAPTDQWLSCLPATLLALAALLVAAPLAAQPTPPARPPKAPKTLTLSADALQDKIKGGWAGQTIGVTVGGPTEFQYKGTLIQDYQPLVWYEGYLKKTMTENPGLYDDLYMDLTFVDVLEKEGLDAPAASFARAFASAQYPLWHANQAARYNLQHGMSAPASGQWQHNPHADCIDYQIEADYAGLMCPGLPNAASQISDRVGHIMNYGDGWYGGVYIGAMYALAFTSDDVPYIVTEALKTIPLQSRFHQCLSDVIRWHRQYPNDWKAAWFEIEKKWTSERGCPEGVFNALNIDATVNAAYVALGLLYGNGDYTKTLEIATRCGQDSDCNPSSAGGILGTVLGYRRIPAYWKMGLAEVESLPFKYTTMSLNDVYRVGYGHALQTIKRHGGQVSGSTVTIPVQACQPVRLEQSFAGVFPTEKRPIHRDLKDEYSFDFDGTGFVLRADMALWASENPYVFDVDVYLDGQLLETAALPVSFRTRRHELSWRYELPRQKHTVRLKLRNPHESLNVRLTELLVFSDQPATKPTASKLAN